jgi:nucleotide-binding universal stress UspA family protein
MFKHILLPTDGSELSSNAALMAIQAAKALDAKITAMTVVGEYHPVFSSEGFLIPDLVPLKERFDEEQATQAAHILDEVKKAAAKYGVQCFSAVVSSDQPHDAIIRQAEKSKCDLIVMASHGRKGLEGILLGSETHKVLVHSKIPVLVCR